MKRNNAATTQRFAAILLASFGTSVLMIGTVAPAKAGPADPAPLVRAQGATGQPPLD